MTLAQPGPLGAFVVWFWFAGAAGFASWLLVQTLSTVLAFRGRRPVTEKAVLDLLEDCKGELGIETYLAIVETAHTPAHALFGWLRPRPLLPEGAPAERRAEGVRKHHRRASQ